MSDTTFGNSMTPSLRSRVLAWILCVIRFKKIIEKKAFKQTQVRRKKFLPNRIKRSYRVNCKTIQSKSVATYESKINVTKNHIIFFHGGAYIFKIRCEHWKLSEKIVKMSKCRMTHIDYPLAPEHHYKDTFDMVSKAYKELIEQYPTDDFIFMGDSAGGGLALAFAQKLIKENHTKPPSKIILLSPWLDLTLSNPGIKEQEGSDHILTVKMLKHAGMLYANGDQQDQYLLSPINGDFSNLPNTIIFYGTEELFHADCERLKSMTGSDNQYFLFREYQKMQHDWAIFPIPERKQLVNEISDFIDC